MNAKVLFASLFIVAIALFGAGYVVSQSTYLTPYLTVANGQVQNYIASNVRGNSNKYMQIKDDISVYLVPETQLTPKFSSKALSKTSRVMLTYLPGSTGYVDVKASHNVELKGLEYQVIALAVTTGKRTVTYATPQYTSNPDGIRHDQSTMGNRIALAGGGALALFVLLVTTVGQEDEASARRFPDEDWMLFLAGQRVPTWSGFTAGLIAGAFFILVNFPTTVRDLGTTFHLPAVQAADITAQADYTSLFGASLAQQIVSFDGLWSKLLLGVGVYLATLAVLSLRHLRFDLFGIGVLFLGIGAASLHLLSWLVAALIWLLILVWAILGWVFHIIGIVMAWLGNLLHPIFAFIAGVIGGLIGFILHHGIWAVLVVLLVIGLIYLAIKNWDLFKELLIALGIYLVVLGVIFLLVKLIQLLAPLWAFLGRVLSVVGRYVFYILVGALVGWIVYGLGSYLLDQFKGAWNSGSGRRGVMVGALAVGTSVALILMESNLYDAVAYYPSAFAGFVTANLHQSSPIFDVLVALLLLAVSLIGMLRNLPQLLTGPEGDDFQTPMVVGALVTAALGLVAGIIFIYGAIHQQST